MTALFQLQEVSFSYVDGRAALERVSLEIQAQEKVIVLGANGSGKSTLLKIMDGLILPRSGEVVWNSRPLTPDNLEDVDFNRVFRSQVGFVFQEPDAQLFSGSVYEEVAFGPLQLGLGEEEVRRRVRELLQLLRLEALAGRPPYELSGGEKKRVAIASVLATDPATLLLDEPTDGLDPRSKWELIDILLDLHRAGKTIMTATNDMDIVDVLADRLIILDEQKSVLAAGSTLPLLQDTALLEKANLIHIHAHRHAGSEHRHPHVHVPSAEHHLKIEEKKRD